jgi:hypothetical protein
MGLMDDITEAFKEHLKFLRRACDDATRHITRSREAIERSYELLRLATR